jgi:hypothetical protein
MTIALQKKFADYNPDIGNGYVPAMQFAADVMESMTQVVAFGTPPAASTTNIVTTQSIATAVTLQRSSLLSFRAAARFGATIRVIASGAATSTIDVYGRDYVGQPIRETLTLNGASAVAGVKVFKLIDRIVFGATAATTASVGWGGIWGVPFKSVAILAEIVDGALGTNGTLTAPVLTDPQTATTGDPRGRYTPNTTPDGAKDVSAVFIVDNSINAAGNGGLLGIQHKGE